MVRVESIEAEVGPEEDLVGGLGASGAGVDKLLAAAADGLVGHQAGDRREELVGADRDAVGADRLRETRWGHHGGDSTGHLQDGGPQAERVRGLWVRRQVCHAREHGRFERRDAGPVVRHPLIMQRGRDRGIDFRVGRVTDTAAGLSADTIDGDRARRAAAG